MSRILTKKELLNSPNKDVTIEQAKKTVLQMMDIDNRVLFSTFTKQQQEDFIIELAYEDNVIEIRDESKKEINHAQ
jgi:hypothetical protein